MIIKINDERGFEQSTLYFGYLEENNSTTIEFEFPEYLEKYNKKLNFMLADGTTVCKLFDDINSNKFTFTRDLLKFNKLQMAIEFFDTNEDLIYRTSILTIRISDSIICDDDISEDDPKVVILDTLIQKVTELDSTLTENESVRAENESERETNENVRISNENTRISNENKRSEEENNRISAESTRVSNEKNRVESENQRITQEETRQSNESTRISNEEIREQNETQRIANEKIRQENANQLSTTIEKKMNKTTEKISLIEVSSESGAKGIDGNIVENPANTFKTFKVEGIDEVYVNGRNHFPNEPLVIFYDNTNTLISYIDTGENSQTCQDFKVEVPENAVTMIVNGRTEDPAEAIASAYYYKYIDFQDSFNNEIERVLKLIPSRTTKILETIDIDDSSESDLNELKAFGNSKQGSTTGAQLLEITNTNLDNGDLKVTNNNGILSVVGTPPDVNYNKEIGTFVCEESGVYCLEDNVSRTDERIRIIYRINDSNWINGNSSYLLELQAGDIVHFNLRINSMLNYNDILKPMFNKGTTKLEWEPYTGGNPSPNPDYPQEIESIKDSITFKRIGKNYNKYPYFDGDSFSQNGVTYTVQEDLGIKIEGTSTGETYYDIHRGYNFKKGTYKVSVVGLTDNILLNIVPYLKDGSHLDALVFDKNNTVKDLILEEDVTLNDYIAIVNTDVTVNTTLYLQIEKGTEVTEYEPYHEDVYTINLNTDLNSINILSKQLEYNYVDEDGNKYLCDVIDFKNKKIIKYLNKIILPKENITWIQNKDETDFFEITNFYILNQYQARGDLAISNYFRDYRYKSNYLVANLGTIYIRFPKSSGIDTLQKAQEFMDTHDVEVLYVLAKPKEIDLTDEELSYLEQFPLQKGINHIFSDDELSPKFKLKYYQDVNILLDKINKNIADVSAQLIEGGSNV